VHGKSIFVKEKKEKKTLLSWSLDKFNDFSIKEGAKLVSPNFNKIVTIGIYICRIEVLKRCFRTFIFIYLLKCPLVYRNQKEVIRYVCPLVHPQSTLFRMCHLHLDQETSLFSRD